MPRRQESPIPHLANRNEQQMVLAVPQRLKATDTVRITPEIVKQAVSERARRIALGHTYTVVDARMATLNEQPIPWVMLHLFPLGQMVATPGALAALKRTNQQASGFLDRHVFGDWGNLDLVDKRENEYSVTRGLRILSAYRLNDETKIWVITEADRSATTILLLEEY